MANEIYNSSYWGNGVCDNTIDWGETYKDWAGCTPTPPIVGDFIIAENGDYVLAENNDNLIIE